MPTFEFPIAYNLAVPPGAVAGPVRRILTASVPVEVANHAGRFREVPGCRLDTGCSTTTMSATLARSLGVPFPTSDPYVLTTNTTAGRVTATVYFGELKVKFITDPAHTFRLFCQFSENVPPSTPLLLGLHDALEVFRFTFDAAGSSDAPAGYFRLETYA